MSLNSLFDDLAECLRSAEFLLHAAHPDHPNAIPLLNDWLIERAEHYGFTCVRDFLRSGLSEQVVTLRAADRCDVLDFECPGEPQTVRLIRHIASNGQVRVLMTNLCSLRESVQAAQAGTKTTQILDSEKLLSTDFLA